MLQELVQHRKPYQLSKHNPAEAVKWIVVTTINLPTQDMKKLANQSGWQLVVVGDKKTPEQWW